MESHGAPGNSEESILRELSNVQIMISAARDEQIRLTAENITDQSELVKSLYENVIETLDQFQWLSDTTVPKTSSRQLHMALANYFYGNCYHYLDDRSKAITYLTQAASHFNGLPLDATFLSMHANNMLLKGINEQALGSHKKLSYFIAAESTLTSAIELWDKLDKRGVTSALRGMAEAEFYLGQVQTWNGHSGGKAKSTCTVLQSALKHFTQLNKNNFLSDTEFQINLNMIYHFLDVNYLRCNQLEAALKYLNLLLCQAEALKDKSLQYDAMLGIALCKGLQSTEGFFDPEVISHLGRVYQYYYYDTENPRLRSISVGVVRIWLQGLTLPENGPDQLEWIRGVIQSDAPSESKELSLESNVKLGT